MERNLTIKDNIHLHISESRGGDTTVILVHGLTGNHKQMYYYQEKLAEDFTVISYDIRGRGDSSPASENTSIFTHAEDLQALIETLNIQNPILVGYSMGGYICALVASKLENVEKLVLLDGAGAVDDTQRELIAPSLKRLEKDYPSAEAYINETKNVYEKLAVDWDDITEAAARHEVMLVNDYWEHKSNVYLIRQDFESFYDFPAEGVFMAIQCKTMLVIATGTLGSKASLFDKSSYMKLRQILAPSEVKVTNVNHYELVFNKQLETIQKVHTFIEKGR
ncbi:alpha/beta hydrolase [Salicibibacter cibarius]|uniref:Alpha/beta hydrolase n=1 Tax=Salicibibacter cibarius TaxID=2743000 RepID=A0A7T6Z0G2_9BACI|nr:alpha/beta hydrolase [Salicibibacter cibarius]QQK74397.1 alpha/beta hydrolase [Salicibibacter cibarius]